jgi:hypothetical protein
MAQYQTLGPRERAEVDALIAADIRDNPWVPLIDVEDPAKITPQRAAYESEADFTLYGGAAGGGKSDLLVGLAATRHVRSIIFRREGTQLRALIDRAAEILGREHFNGQWNHFRLPGNRLVRFGGMKDAGSEKAYQGQPHDFMGFDEVTEFLEAQFRFVVAWNRTTIVGQRFRVVAASNPPTTAEGEWIIRFWAPWLDEHHPNPALPGELRWFVMTEDGDREVDGPEPIEIDGEMVSPRSRTFIPSSVEDNPFLMATGYKAQLQALPEPLRSQMLRGDFTAGRDDNPWQVIPTAWVRAAQDRWTPHRPPGPMTALGVDVAMGGAAKTVMYPRYGDWFGEPIEYPGTATPDSQTTAGLVVGQLRDGAPALIDVIGPGGEVYGHLHSQGVNAVRMAGGEPSHAVSRDGGLRFFNKRSEWWWRMREALDPMAEFPISLPPRPELRADLCSARWSPVRNVVKVEPKPDIIKRLGRSPDHGDAAVYALEDAPRKGPMAGVRALPTKANSSYSPTKWRR